MTIVSNLSWSLVSKRALITKMEFFIFTFRHIIWTNFDISRLIVTHRNFVTIESTRCRFYVIRDVHQSICQSVCHNYNSRNALRISPTHKSRAQRCLKIDDTQCCFQFLRPRKEYSYLADEEGGRLTRFRFLDSQELTRSLFSLFVKIPAVFLTKLVTLRVSPIWMTDLAEINQKKVLFHYGRKVVIS